MKLSLKFIFLVLLVAISNKVISQNTPIGLDSKWRAGISLQYAISFKNITTSHPSVGYSGILGGFTGRGIELFGGRKVHKYLSVELSGGVLLNSYNRFYDPGINIVGRFNKVYIQPGVKFLYPFMNRDFGSLYAFVGGSMGLFKSGRFFLEEQYGNFRETLYARYDPVLAPGASFGVEIHFSDFSNLLIGVKYQSGTFLVNDYYSSSNPNVTLRDMPDDLKEISATGIGIMLGILHEF